MGSGISTPLMPIVKADVETVSLSANDQKIAPVKGAAFVKIPGQKCSVESATPQLSRGLTMRLDATNSSATMSSTAPPKLARGMSFQKPEQSPTGNMPSLGRGTSFRQSQVPTMTRGKSSYDGPSQNNSTAPSGPQLLKRVLSFSIGSPPQQSSPFIQPTAGGLAKSPSLTNPFMDHEKQLESFKMEVIKSGHSSPKNGFSKLSRPSSPAHLSSESSEALKFVVGNGEDKKVVFITKENYSNVDPQVPSRRSSAGDVATSNIIRIQSVDGHSHLTSHNASRRSSGTASDVIHGSAIAMKALETNSVNLRNIPGLYDHHNHHDDKIEEMDSTLKNPQEESSQDSIAEFKTRWSATLDQVRNKQTFTN